MPGRVRLGAASAQVRCYHWPEMVHPPAHCFISNRNAAFCQQIFDIAKAQGKSQIEPDRLLDDLGREPIPFVANFLIPLATEPQAGPQARNAVTKPFAGMASTQMPVRRYSAAKVPP